MTIIARPDLKVDVAFGSSPFTALDDPALVWTDITDRVELDKTISIQRRRANELDEPQPGTLSLTLDNSDGRFTRLNPSSPYYPNVKHNRLIRVRAFWNPSSSINLLTKRQATGGQADPDTTGFHVPSGTKASPIATATATAAGTTTTFKCADADAADLETGDVITIASGGVGDTFTRSVSNGRGTADSGSVWTIAAGPPASAFSVTGSVARDALATVNLRHFATAGSFTDVDIVTAVTVSVTATGQSISGGAVARYFDDQNFYLLQLLHDAAGTVDLQIVKRVGGNFTTLASVNDVITYTPGTATNARFQIVGDDLQARVWTGATEPTAWNLTATDTSFTAGATGTHSNLVSGNTNALPVNVDYDTFFAAPIAATSGATTYRQITGTSSAAGTTTVTFSPAATVATAAGDTLIRYRVQWDTGNQQVTGSRITTGYWAPDTAGPVAVPVTAGLSYTWSYWAKRAATAISVSPRILWYDSTGALLSESTGSTSALTTTLTRYTQTATAPANAVFARCAVANETIFNPAANVGFRGAASAKSTSGNIPTNIPAAAQTGDALLMWVNIDTASGSVTTPSGWTLVDTEFANQSKTYMFRRVATASDAGKALTVTTTGTKTMALILAYSGTDTTNPVHQFNSTPETVWRTTHTTPNVTTTVASCWIISGVFDRSSTTANYTQPGGDTKRAQVYNTGSLATTGAVSDNAAAVAAGTYGTKVWTGNTEDDDVTMWTVAVKPGTTSGSATGTLFLTGLQFEQAASASAWAVPAGIYARFVGHVDSWPTAWEGGFRALTTITATDRMKLLSDAKVQAAITEQIRVSAPVACYPLGEDSDATAAGNVSATSQPSLPVVSVGTVTDDMLEWGGGTGPGTDAQSALKLTPTSSTVGKALRGKLTAPLGGDGIAGMTIAVFINTTITGATTRVAAGVDDGKTTDGGAAGIFDVGINPAGPLLRGHLKFGSTDILCDLATNYADGHTHMLAITATLSGDTATVNLYVDGVFKTSAGASAGAVTEFPRFNRFNVGCGALDTISYLWSGTLSYAIGWNRALDVGELADLWDAGNDGFTGDLPGPRAQRIADWAGLTTTDFETGVETLGSHPSTEATLLDAFRLVAKSEGGVFFVARDGYSTLQDRSHRTNAATAFTVTAAEADPDVSWAEDPTLIANDVTVKYGGNEVHAPPDLASQADYGVKSEDLETILATDEQATNRGSAYITRYGQPISRPDGIAFEALTPSGSLFSPLLAAEIGTKFTMTGLPTGAPSSSVDLFIEGIGEEINQDSWKFSLDCSPAGFDFGLILDHATRGLLDSNYLGW